MIGQTPEDRRVALFERVADAIASGVGCDGALWGTDEAAEAVLAILESEGWLSDPRHAQGPYATWWILRSQPAQSDGFAVAGKAPLPEKIERVRKLREERPELGGWVLERIDQMHVRGVEEDPLRVLGDWYPYLPEAEVAGILAELSAPGVES